MMVRQEDTLRQSEEKSVEEKMSKEPTPEISISRVDLPMQMCEIPALPPVVSISHYEAKAQTDCAPSINLIENITKETIEITSNQNVILENQLIEKQIADVDIIPEPQMIEPEPEPEMEPEPELTMVPMPMPMPMPIPMPIVEEIVEPVTVVPIIQEVEVEKEIVNVEMPQPEQIEVVPEVKESIEVVEVENPPVEVQPEAEPAPEC